MYKIGQIFENKYPSAVAVWCNQNNAYIEKIGDKKYQIKEIPQPSQEDIEVSIKKVRDEMISSMSWRVERAKEQQELGIETVDDYGMLLEYRQYLRDYPEKVEDWYEQNPMTFEEWKNQ